ncbi:MAG: hypothetical protein A2V77_09365 [Anaeromyxobacter sp. RBG_16_69_14]|nr:MAG: hypothetical protein A2V77_09365 [Anaeromyxobacter sp. RBG_16_69_14]HLA82058.1 hypothetical protein [Thermoleophilia bacterium]
MPHVIHQPVVAIVQNAISIMDALLRDRIDLQSYIRQIKELDADSLLAQYQADFRQDPALVYYLDALMMLSSLQHELDFQVSEYGANVASEDVSMLKELLEKFPPMESPGSARPRWAERMG